MPRYYFHLRNQEDLLEDHEGMDLPDLKAALEEALRVDQDLALDPAGIYDLEFGITDSTGKTLLKVPVQERRRSHRYITANFSLGFTVALTNAKRLANALSSTGCYGSSGALTSPFSCRRLPVDKKGLL